MIQSLIGFLILIMSSMLFLGVQVVNSLITNMINDKTYEHAMLRTLGWN
jgi:ABC-type lipoprotein release transport system permease subunit